MTEVQERAGLFGPAHAAHDATRDALEVRHVSVRYASGTALDDVSFRLQKGDRVALVGPNGAGKSTLFRVVAGLVRPDAGEILVYGQQPGRHICIAYVAQRPRIDWAFPVSVFDVVLMGRSGTRGLFRRARRTDRDFARHCLDRVGLSAFATRQIGELSGGQQQRMFIARSLAQEAELMLLDEPFNGVDTPSQEEIFRILDSLTAEGVSLMVATHDLNLAAERFPRIVLMNRRLVKIGPAAEVLTADTLAETYGGQMRAVKTDKGLLLINDTCCNGGRE